MMGVSVAECWIYGAGCNAACAIVASEMVWVEQNELILQMPGTNFEKLPCGGLQNGQWVEHHMQSQEVAGSIPASVTFPNQPKVRFINTLHHT